MASTETQIGTQETAVSRLFQQVRARTMELVAPLEIEDYVIQTAEFMSPPRWHIGHTSWFFETLLQTYEPEYKIYSPDYLFYFNSYYEGFGARIERPKRGTRSRPTVKETVAYRRHVDEQMLKFLETVADQPQADTILKLVRLGLEHEMQHQELLVYDIKHLLCDQFNAPIKPAPVSSTQVDGMVEVQGGLIWLGYGRGMGVPPMNASPSLSSHKIESCSTSHAQDAHATLLTNYAFAFDNEKPAHQVYIRDFSIDRAPVSNGDYLEFMADRGYQDFRWWFSEAWEVVNREHWAAPLYWELHDGEWMIRDFSGFHSAKSKANEPVSHVSYYEASAFAKWAGKRLPTEAEWERVAGLATETDQGRLFPWGDDPVEVSKANLFENGLWRVSSIGAYPEGQNSHGCHQLIGDVWEWTTSDYVPYPGFKSEFDEYNDKWFVNQKVLRGGSFATPQLHIRSTYRNFFHAHERWMVSGFRCAKDL
ncbi:MAG TPA: ergothioneine biosynthesis protein EgtB [Pyrinomonadaceae bacterium]|nr:ergothioneine biosynthesis protein EgtB [Pyrinomonadaceae bacterium]